VGAGLANRAERARQQAGSARAAHLQRRQPAVFGLEGAQLDASLGRGGGCRLCGRSAPRRLVSEARLGRARHEEVERRRLAVILR